MNEISGASWFMFTYLKYIPFVCVQYSVQARKFPVIWKACSWGEYVNKAEKLFKETNFVDLTLDKMS